jgi:hypothetical protein
MQVHVVRGRHAQLKAAYVIGRSAHEKEGHDGQTRQGYTQQRYRQADLSFSLFL